MSTGMAAVQARIAQIQGSFGAMGGVRPPVASTATATTSAAATATPTSFTSQLQAQQTSLDLSATAGTPTASPLAPSGTGAASGQTGEQVLALATQHLGTPYVWGGASPGGFDCSGLMQWSYRQVGIDLPRVSTDQAKAGRPVSAADARPGDLVFFERGRVDHIGMYAGGGKWVVAPKTGDVVKLQDVDLAKATTIRRIVPDTAAAAPALAGATAAAGSSPYAGLFAAAGAKHGVSPALLTAVARAESGFDPNARSSAGARGLMQLMPATAAGLGVDPLKPAEAVDGAARLLKQHLQRFGTTELALAAYNAGPGAVAKHGGVPPYAETKAYIAKIMAELRGRSA